MKNGTRFKFDDRWVSEEDSRGIVNSSWEGNYGGDAVQRVCMKLNATRDALINWSKGKMAPFKQEIAEVRRKLATYLEQGVEDDKELRVSLECKLSDLLFKEMIFWKQKAKVAWLMEGDANTRFFHRVASEKKRRVTLSDLFNEEGKWCHSETEMQQVVIDYFSRLFKERQQGFDDKFLEGIPSVLSTDMNTWLIASIDKSEVYAALKQMYPSKGPGPDGFSPGFYQAYWNVIGDDITAAVRAMVADEENMRSVNQTLVTLIPKVKEPKCMTNLRPISLCNVLYKMASKVLANRLKPLLDSFISNSQSAFVPGWRLTDNALLAFEVIHCMKKRRQGRNGLCALKLDMSKAYDRVDWKFVESMMRRLGFCEEWIHMIMSCVTTVSYSFIINGVQKGRVVPKRGLRQGDALSPFLFLLVGELLSRFMRAAEANGSITGVQTSRGAPSVTHLLFADDAFLFCKAASSDIIGLQYVLRMFCLATGQEINFQKCAISFSRKVPEEEKLTLAEMLGVSQVAEHTSYLGLPMNVGHAKVAAFRFIVDRMSRKTKGWKERHLSSAGKLVMLKAVVQAIPSFVMQCFELPKTLCDDMHGIMSQFWWGESQDGSRRIHWIAWNKLCARKDAGGLGLRNMHQFNAALLAMQGWRIIRQPNSLLSKVLKAKYFPNTSFLQATVGSGAFFTWRSIAAGRKVLDRGIRYLVGNGKNIAVWGDKWLPLQYGFKPISLPPDGLESLKVCDLICHDTGSWKVDYMRGLLFQFEVEMISRIPISSTGLQDKLIWHHDKSGVYTVRGGYWAWRGCEEIVAASSSSDDMGGAWRNLWGINIPEKVKVFCWKLLMNIIPTKSRLRDKHCSLDDDACPMCGMATETTEQVF